MSSLGEEEEEEEGEEEEFSSWTKPWSKSMMMMGPNVEPSQQVRELKGKEKETSSSFPYDDSLLPAFTGSNSFSSHESSIKYPYLYPPQQIHSHKFTQHPIKHQPTTPPRAPRTSLLLSFVRKKPNHANSIQQRSSPLVIPEVIEISRPYSYAQEEQERERLRDAAAQSIGLIEFAPGEHPDDSHEELHALDLASLQDPPLATTEFSVYSPSIPASSFSHIPTPTPSPRLPPFPSSFASLTTYVTLAGSFSKFCPSSSLLVYALAKQWKTRFIVLTSAFKGSTDDDAYLPTISHLHLFKSNLSSSSELHRLPITQDTAIYVTEQSGPGTSSSSTMRNANLSKRDSKNGARGTGSKPSGTVVAIEQGSFVWHFEMQDPTERQKWIGAIKAIVLGQRSMRAGLTAAPHTLSEHEPRGDMDVMLSMRLQASLSSVPSPVSPFPSATSLRTPVLATSPLSPSPVSFSSAAPSIPQPSVDVLNSQTRTPTLSPPVIPPSTAAKLELLARKSSKKSQTSSTKRSSSSGSGPGSGSSSPTHSIHLHPKRTGSTTVQMHSAKSSTSTTKTIKGIFTPRSRSPSLSEHEGEYAEESFGTVGSSLMNIGPPIGVGVNITRTGSPMRRADSPVPSVASSTRDESSGLVPNVITHNRNVYNAMGYTGSSNFNGVPPADLKIVKEDERWSPSRSSSPFTHLSSLSPLHLSSLPLHTSSHSLRPPPRKKQMAVYTQEDTVFQHTDTADSSIVSTFTEDLEATTATPRAVTPTPRADPARLSVLTMSTTTSGSGVERSGSSSSTPSRRWSRTLPKRLTPPSGPLPLTPPHPPHEAELSLSPSSSSSDSPSTAFWKRVSGSSSASNTSARSSPVHHYAAQRVSAIGPLGAGGVSGSKRRSMPPPRPAPSFAPPPAPEQQPSQTTRFRTSVAQRALKLSLTMPRPPPSGVLPPRPDEVEFAYSHRRSLSNNSADIPPPSSPPPRPDSAASSRSMSIKQRLRILSAPSPSTQPHDTAEHSITTYTMPNPDNGDRFAHSPSPTPPLPGTPITTMQNHPSFLQLATPMVPTIPPRHPLRPPPPQRLLSAPEITSLSPPPRRGSKQLVAKHPPEKVVSELPDFSDICVEGSSSLVSVGVVEL